MPKVDEKLPEAFWKERDFREFSFEVRAAAVSEDDSTEALYVEGYACRFNEVTVLYEYGDYQYKEKVDSRALSEADMTDVIFNYNHGGKVVARTRNKTLELKVDAKGLFIRARLDGTDEGVRLYKEIKGGYIDRMSYAYTTKETSYDSETRTRTVLRVKKVYDVSAVDIPAYDSTSISARSYFDGQQEAERLAAEETETNKTKRKKLALLAQTNII